MADTAAEADVRKENPSDRTQLNLLPSKDGIVLSYGNRLAGIKDE